MSFLKTQVSSPTNVSSIFSAMRQNSNTLLLAQTLYTKKESPLKDKLMRFLGALVKIGHIPPVNFELTSQFLFKFCIIFHCHDKKCPVNFEFINFLLWIKGSHQSPNF